MKKLLLFACVLFALNTSYAQPELTSWIMTSGFAQYQTGAPVITMSDSGDVLLVCYNTTDVYIQSNGLAGTYVMGQFVGNPNTPSAQNYTFKITRQPTQEMGTKTGVPLGGSVGVAINGAVYFGYGDGKSYKSSTGMNAGNGDGNWWADAWISEGSTMDPAGNGHPTGGGVYHYHANPIQFYSTSGANHSPIIGYAYDGYPIYGPFGYTSAMNSSSGITRMLSGYELRNISDRTQLLTGPSIPAGPAIGGSFPLGTYIQDYEYTGVGDLDQYNGRLCVTPEYPGPVGTYAYFITTESNGDPKFPYIFASEYYGEVDNTSTNNSMPGGLNCGLVTEVNDVQESSITSTLYPNPAYDKISFDFENVHPTEILISNTVGQVVLRTNIYSQIDISDLISGIYNVTIVFEEKIESIKFVKQ